ncbi:MAG: tRNA adenosine(34) deaminase TadA [Candidatus Aminicenantales bacterium]
MPAPLTNVTAIHYNKVASMKTQPIGADTRLMASALEAAAAAAAAGEVPVGAVIVRDGKTIACGSNRPIRSGDPTAHAEIVAIRTAAKKLGNYRLTGCEIFVTVEPCAMCLGAIIQARIRRLVYGATDPKAGAVKSIVRFPIHKTNHKLEIRGGILADECASLLRDFFRERRKLKNG